MSKFGVVELARTGRICLRRGEALLERGSNLPEAPVPSAASAAMAVANVEAAKAKAM